MTDPARVASPRDKPKVERAVQYVRGNFWAGEHFTDLADAQARAVRWCTETAGMRMHGTICARPLEVFTADEQHTLLPLPAVAYDPPILRTVKVHKDFHAEIGKALYSLPGQWIGSKLDARADRELVKFYHRGQLVKVHPRQPAGGRHTDPSDLPEHKAGYAMRDLDALVATCAGHGHNIGIYAERLLDNPLPWTRMRSVYGLLGLVKRYGARAGRRRMRHRPDPRRGLRAQDRLDARTRHRDHHHPPCPPPPVPHRPASPATPPNTPPRARHLHAVPDPDDTDQEPTR